MKIIGFELIKGFIGQHSDSESSLNSWYKTARKANWKTIVEVKQTYRHADAVGICTVFNIKGNHYRLITLIDYHKHRILIRSVLTHAEYDKEKWKKDCGR
ncbi:MAG TPA: type II toxin-antitoxin system HigB family toxin [Pyrinomonadaceae bacterium]|jgi:mRNA interferase HigB